MSQAQVYEIPVVFHDLRSGESLLQLFDSLQELEFVSQDIFMRISSRVNYEKGRLANIQQRTANCKAKVAMVTGTTRATTVFSTAKYPAPELLPNYATVYSNVQQPKPVPRPAWKAKRIRPAVDIAERRLDGMALNWEVDREEKVVKQDGLGRLPHNVTSISSLLLFNTAENPYKKYVSLDNLLGVDRRKREEEKKVLDAAPQTILEGDVLPQFGLLEYMYRPQLGEVPDLNLPQVLPGVEGAADINWTLTAGLPELPSIAPSQAALPQLPTVGILDFRPAAVAAPASVVAGGGISGDSPSFDAGGPPAPPPPPDGMVAQPEAPEVAGGAPPPPPPPPPPGGAPEAAPPAAAGGPPAPPPPPPPLAAGPPNVDPLSVGAAPPPNAITGDRSDLLASIRAAGMKSLKKVDAQSVEKQKEEAAVDAGGSSSQGGVMGDLVRQLSLRRQAMGGSGGGKGGGKKKGKKMIPGDVPRPPKESMEKRLLEATKKATRHDSRREDDSDAEGGDWE